MTKAEKIQTIKTMLEDTEVSDSLIEVYLFRAEKAILNRMYPFRTPEDFEVPSKYELLQCDLVVRYISKSGAEGEISHNENGIGRSYGSTNEEDLLKEVMQVI